MAVSRLGGGFTTVAMAMLMAAKDDPARRAFCRSDPDNSDTDNTGGLGGTLRWFTWGHIAQWVFEACAALENHRLPKGAHVATVARNSAEWFVVDFACQTLGLVHVAIDPGWPAAMVAGLIEQSDARGVFAPPSIALPETRLPTLRWSVNWDTPSIASADLQHLIERAQSVPAGSPAQMLFTSGTSGEPKGVLLSHRNLVSNALGKLDAAPQRDSDLRLNILPFCHAYARTCELTTWVLSRSRLALAHDWSNFLLQAKRLQPSLVNLVPHLANKLFEPERMQATGGAAVPRLAPPEVVQRLGGRVRLLQCGGAALPDALWYELERCGLPPLQGYGLTEASPVVCSNRAGEQQPGLIGKPIAGVELRIDSLGQLWVRGENVMCGYYADPLATRARIQDGWLATGDLVARDELGRYRVSGRISEVIVLSTGFKVSPELVENRLADLPGIERVLVAGQDRPYLVAVVWPAWNALPRRFFGDASRDHQAFLPEVYRAELARAVGERLADIPSFMHPRKLILVTSPSDSETTAGLVNLKGGWRRRPATSHFECQIDAAYAQRAFEPPDLPRQAPSKR